MKVKGRFDHFNINVTDLDKSIKFYETALGLHESHRKEASDGSFVLVYMADDHSNFLLELTWLRDHTQPYELGENESHLCLRVEGDYDEVRKFHKEMGCVCFENTAMGLYFINDPDDYWIEILPVSKTIVSVSNELKDRDYEIHFSRWLVLIGIPDGLARV
jgi:glyox_I: lactoylglutathione lyase